MTSTLVPAVSPFRLFKREEDFANRSIDFVWSLEERDGITPQVVLSVSHYPNSKAVVARAYTRRVGGGIVRTVFAFGGSDKWSERAGRVGHHPVARYSKKALEQFADEVLAEFENSESFPVFFQVDSSTWED